VYRSRSVQTSQNSLDKLGKHTLDTTGSSRCYAVHQDQPLVIAPAASLCVSLAHWIFATTVCCVSCMRMLQNPASPANSTLASLVKQLRPSTSRLTAQQSYFVTHRGSCCHKWTHSSLLPCVYLLSDSGSERAQRALTREVTQCFIQRMTSIHTYAVDALRQLEGSGWQKIGCSCQAGHEGQ
jgi:hypothetical protein